MTDARKSASRSHRGQTCLISGKRMELRLWKNVEPQPEEGAEIPERERPYETVGYVLEGRAKLHRDDHTTLLTVGDVWLVPAWTPHAYEVLEPFTAVEATSPPIGSPGWVGKSGSPEEP